MAIGFYLWTNQINCRIKHVSGLLTEWAFQDGQHSESIRIMPCGWGSDVYESLPRDVCCNPITKSGDTSLIFLYLLKASGTTNTKHHIILPAGHHLLHDKPYHVIDAWLFAKPNHHGLFVVKGCVIVDNVVTRPKVWIFTSSIVGIVWPSKPEVTVHE